MSRSFAWSTVLVGLALSGCGGSPSTPNPVPTPYDFGTGSTAKLKDNVVVLPKAATDQAQVTNTTVTLPRAGNEALLASLKPGSPLVGARRTSVFASNNAFGMLRKVVSISADDTSIHITTSPGTLADVFEGDFSVATPPDTTVAINPAGLDVVAYFFGTNPGIDLANCDMTGVCTTPPADGTKKAKKAKSVGSRRSPLFGSIPSRYTTLSGTTATKSAATPASPTGPAASAKSLSASDLQAAGPTAIAAAMSDVVAVRTGVRAVAENGIDSFSQDDTQKLFRIMARNFTDGGDMKNAAAATTIANYVADPTHFQAFRRVITTPSGSLVSTKGIFDDIAGAIESLGEDILNAFTSLLDVNVTLTLPTLGRTKDNAASVTFLTESKTKTLGKAEFAVAASGKASAYAYVSSSAHFDGHIGVPTTINFYLSGEAGGGASLDATLSAMLQSSSAEEPSAAQKFLSDPESSPGTWEKQLAHLGPYEGPSIGPVPTAFNIELSVECSWKIYAQMHLTAAADVKATAKIGASYSSSGGWSKIDDFTWSKTSSETLELGGGAQMECALVTKLDWLIADVVGPYVTFAPGISADLTYAESCSEATTTKPDASVEMNIDATLKSEVGASIDFAGFDLGDLPAATLLDEDWNLYTHEYSWPASGFGYCSVSCIDQRKNGDETDVDCGGSCATAGKTCKKGQTCKVTADCAAGGSCSGGMCVDPAHCSDGMQDGDETGSDCGGSCSGCAIGGACTVASDCASLHCEGGACGAATCTDGQKNGTETDVDCGVACAGVKRLCAIGKGCSSTSDCVTGATCTGGSCTAPPACSDGYLDAGETGADCGGPCPPCTQYYGCKVNTDCESGVCSATGKYCEPASCKDGTTNEDETDVDCGGSCATSGNKCATGQACKVASDCAGSDQCLANRCVPAAHCSNGKKDSNETDVDCGGPDCYKCTQGKVCTASSDCATTSCMGGTCRSASCFDGVKDQDESDIDCGGTCNNQSYKFCNPGQACNTNADCGSNYNPGQYCNFGHCSVGPLCTNFVQDKSDDETDIDCGGGRCALCSYFQKCSYYGDCASSICRTEDWNCLGSDCDTHRCRNASCNDGYRNGDETDVDCGGSCGTHCQANQHCAANTDCLAGYSCVTGICLPPSSCSDSVKNGAESDVDCGGGLCPACADAKACRGPLDCVSNSCSGGVCIAATCGDGVKNGLERAVDCGAGGSCPGCKFKQPCNGGGCAAGLVCSGNGGDCIDRNCANGKRDGNETDVDCGAWCSPCADGKTCSVNGDCGSGVCSGGKCAAGSCGDGVKNGNETDVDCGGGTCAACPLSKRCNYGFDCATGSCSAGACQSASCTDGLQNPGETDVDCGGTCVTSSSKTCIDGKKCAGDTDCKSGFCHGGVCAETSCTDGVKHGTETDVDCGGVCPKCPNGAGCMVAGDCVQGVCNASTHTCSAAGCGDLVKNGDETATDCGGSCPACADLSTCLVNHDCKSRYCNGGTCAIAACNDGVSDGKESGLDCGGGTCAACGLGGGCLAGTDCTSSVCNVGGCAPVTCTDGVANGSETDIDCGGSCALLNQRCVPGKKCSVGTDCASGTCTAGVCVAAGTCSNGKLDGNETSVDCGGGCAACYIGDICRVGSDCQYGVCTGGVCATPSCSDGIRNNSEPDVDCGGGTGCALCATGKRCAGPAQCASGVCTSGFCAGPASCTNGLKDAGETDVDCGGGTCIACAPTKACAAARDCQTGVCTGGVCKSATCGDGVKNEDETDVDCGGACDSSGARCGLGKRCSATADCTSPNSCSLDICIAPPSCTDGIQNQNETDIDCGGVCGGCAAGKHCGAGTDCSTHVCTGTLCAAASCSDGFKNGAETDVDCGGGTCPKCANTLVCTTGTDCQSAVCGGGHCSAPTCTDGVKNQDETAADCGGACDAAGKRCAVGAACVVANDCTSNYCPAGTCANAGCNDMVMNGSETDVDCGGSCPACATGKSCALAADCLTATCTSFKCAAPACSPSCGTGASCGAGTDCTSGTCTSGKCAAPACGPNCTDGQACGSNGDCVSGLCKANVCAPLYGTASTFAVDSFPWQVGVGDLDADGKFDIVTATDNGNLDILYGTGGGAFAAYTAYGSGNIGIDGMGILDLDGDGKLDLAYLDAADTNVVTALGHANRTFSGAVSSSPTGMNFASGITYVDVSGDSRPDAIYRDGIQSFIGVMLQTSGGAFAAPVKYAVEGNGNGDASVAAGVGKLNADSYPDLVVPNFDGTLSVLLGTGAGSFGTAASFAGGTTSPRDLHLADVDEDGKQDVIVTANGALHIVHGNGDGTLGASTSYGSTRCWSAAIFDLNGDGHLDIACGSDNAMIILLGKGSGGFAAPRSYATGTYNYDVAVADMDGDGDLDVVLATNGSTVITVFYNQTH